MSKSHVTMEQHHCPICGEDKDTGALLLDKRLRERFERHTLTGLSICDDCKTQGQKGYIALVGADPEKSVIIDNRIKPDSAYRTPEYLWLKREAAAQIFNIDIEDHPFMYIDPEAIEKVKEIVNAST